MDAPKAEEHTPDDTSKDMLFTSSTPYVQNNISTSRWVYDGRYCSKACYLFIKFIWNIRNYYFKHTLQEENL
jgi:hypothetical protein